MKVELLDSCASDLQVVNAARVSFNVRHEAMEEGDDKLIAFLMKNRHGSPFEKGYFEFYVEAPIFVFREWHRHRAGHSYNEMSGRYTGLESKFYQPSGFRTQTGKPGHYQYEPLNEEAAYYCNKILKNAWEDSWRHYRNLLLEGVAKEQARTVLPVGIYSKMIWSCNPRSLMHFLSLRNAPDAQQEIRECAADAENAFVKQMPVTAAAFISNERIAP